MGEMYHFSSQVLAGDPGLDGSGLLVVPLSVLNERHWALGMEVVIQDGDRAWVFILGATARLTKGEVVTAILVDPQLLPQLRAPDGVPAKELSLAPAAISNDCGDSCTLLVFGCEKDQVALHQPAIWKDLLTYRKAINTNARYVISNGRAVVLAHGDGMVSEAVTPDIHNIQMMHCEKVASSAWREPWQRYASLRFSLKELQSGTERLNSTSEVVASDLHSMRSRMKDLIAGAEKLSIDLRWTAAINQSAEPLLEQIRSLRRRWDSLLNKLTRLVNVRRLVPDEIVPVSDVIAEVRKGWISAEPPDETDEPDKSDEILQLMEAIESCRKRMEEVTPALPKGRFSNDEVPSGSFDEVLEAMETDLHSLKMRSTELEATMNSLSAEKQLLAEETNSLEKSIAVARSKFPEGVSSSITVDQVLGEMEHYPGGVFGSESQALAESLSHLKSNASIQEKAARYRSLLHTLGCINKKCEFLGSLETNFDISE